MLTGRDSSDLDDRTSSSFRGIFNLKSLALWEGFDKFKDDIPKSVDRLSVDFSVPTLHSFFKLKALEIQGKSVKNFLDYGQLQDLNISVLELSANNLYFSGSQIPKSVRCLRLSDVFFDEIPETVWYLHYQPLQGQPPKPNMSVGHVTCIFLEANLLPIFQVEFQVENRKPLVILNRKNRVCPPDSILTVEREVIKELLECDVSVSEMDMLRRRVTCISDEVLSCWRRRHDIRIAVVEAVKSTFNKI
eukprot:TRINITY_DN8270_c0_g1_i1.p1 TRINITY_DN8270_c0_g1~~TRINITY_DN8270_c0_g1_i1.p1  ORF type:complete len:247 (-),score=71.19 TRINITY_DN8270_c0_g1_i1:55-795(-)